MNLQRLWGNLPLRCCLAPVIWASAMSAGAQSTDSAQQQEETSEEAVQVSAEQLDQWIAQLSSDRYQDREIATSKLAQVGDLAIPKLAEAARGKDPESVARAIRILEQISDEGSLESQIHSIRELMTLKNRPSVVRRAHHKLIPIKQRIAWQELVELGARRDDHPDYRGTDSYTGKVVSTKVIVGKAWKGGDDGLRHFLDLKNVVILGIYSAPVSAEGIATLQGSTSLRKIELFGTGLTAKELNSLREQLPHMQIDIRSGAMLGIRGPVGERHARIDEVVKGSAADRAGLEPNDVIIKIDDTPVESFQTLTDKVAQYEPDAEAKLTIRRGQKERLVRVKFGRWK